MEPRQFFTPKMDIIFKIVFGSTRNEDILKDFLQSVLDIPAHEYQHIDITNPYISPEDLVGKSVILDIKVTTISGKIINIEMQVQQIPEMRERMVFYASKMMEEQAKRGDEYSQLKKVINIVIADFRMIDEDEMYHILFLLHDERSGVTFSDIMEIHTLELPKLPKEATAEDGQLLDWLRLFNAQSREEMAELAERSLEMRKAVSIIEELNADEQIRQMAEAAEKLRRDNASRLSGAHREGKREGIEIGIEVGKREGIEVGKLIVAQKLLSLGVDIQQIALATELSVDEIAKLQKEE